MNEIEEAIVESSTWEKFVEFLDFTLFQNEAETIKISVGLVILVLGIYLITSIALTFFKRTISRRLEEADKGKFVTVFSFARWLVYMVILLVVFDSVGVDVTAVFAASAALLIGVGLALQTFFQDIISGVFILVDQSVHVGDIIELEGKIGRVEEIKLRTTRAVTIDNKVLIIPNHLYLTNSLYNWTQNGTTTRENVVVGVAYGSDVNQVKELLLSAARSCKAVLNDPEPMVLFIDFGDSSLDFKLIFTINNSFQSAIPKSDIRYEIDRLFKEHNIKIPFPQRDVHIKRV